MQLIKISNQLEVNHLTFLFNEDLTSRTIVPIYFGDTYLYSGLSSAQITLESY